MAKRNAVLKLLAGIFGVRYEQVRQRAKRRKQQAIAFATLILVAIGVYVANLAWQQHVETIAKAQMEYETLAYQAFSALNKSDPNVDEYVRAAKNALKKGVAEKGLITGLDFRLAHETLVADTVYSSDSDFHLLSDSFNKEVYATTLHQEQLVLIDVNGEQRSYPVKATGWSDDSRSDSAQSISAIEIIQTKNPHG